jgi:cysteine desulfuration protein SufE
MSCIEERAEEIVEAFQDLEDWEDRYRLVIDLGRKLPPLSKEFRSDEYRVKGCQSQVWLHSEYRDGIVHYRADSDSAIAKGIIALLLRVTGDATPEEILHSNLDFLEKIGLEDHLTMNRTNGLYSMFKQIKMDALVYSKLKV